MAASTCPHMMRLSVLKLNGRPGVAGTNLSGFLLELLDGSLVDSTALVDQMAGGGGLAGVDMANDHDVDVGLFLSHCCSFCHEKNGHPLDFILKTNHTSSAFNIKQLAGVNIN